ncbi:MAG: nuclease [Alphaproteobacteria bacterium]|nr:nuclease [Alphaproteobacteria bacterium]
MFLSERQLSESPRAALRGLSVLGLAAAAFAAGVAIGAAIGTPLAGRGIGVAAASAGESMRGVPAVPALRGVHPAEVLRVVDGDTFEARVHLWPGLDITTRVRLRGIDAPELRARCAEERDRAEAARDALRTLLAQGEVGIGRVTLDKYGGRVVADAMTHATPDVARALLEAGAVRRYSGGRRESWCP